VVSLHDFGDAGTAAAGIGTQGWQGMSEDRHSVGEVERVCWMLRGKSALCHVGIFRVGKMDGRKVHDG
jgi:hypothetical protein